MKILEITNNSKLDLEDPFKLKNKNFIIDKIYPKRVTIKNKSGKSIYLERFIKFQLKSFYYNSYDFIIINLQYDENKSLIDNFTFVLIPILSILDHIKTSRVIKRPKVKIIFEENNKNSKVLSASIKEYLTLNKESTNIQIDHVENFEELKLN